MLGISKFNENFGILIKEICVVDTQASFGDK